jgi:hypothetical protein
MLISSLMLWVGIMLLVWIGAAFVCSVAMFAVGLKPFSFISHLIICAIAIFMIIFRSMIEMWFL